MNKFATFFLLFFPSIVFGQMDSTHVKTIDSLLDVSSKLTEQQNFKSALEINAAAEKIALNEYGRESLLYAKACFVHGLILYRQGIYPESEKWQLEAKDIRAKILGTADPVYAASLNSLANLNWAAGRYEKSASFFKETLSIQEKTLGKEHTDYGVTSYNLANLYQDIGEYEKAESLNLTVKKIFEKNLGTKHPYYAAAIFGLGNLYMEMGNYEQAEPLYLEALDLSEKTVGKDNADYAMNLNNLAILYNHKGDFTKSEALYIEAKTIYAKTLGTTHSEYAKSLFNLAILYDKMGSYKKAEPLFMEAISIYEKTLGKQHPRYARSLNALGRLYVGMGDYSKASPLLLEAISLREKMLGKTHYDYATSLENLAYLYWASGDFGNAKQYLAEVGDLEKNLISRAAFYLSERELSSYIKKMESGLSWDFSFARSQAGMSAICYDDLLFYKGYLLNIASQISKIMPEDTAGIRKYNLFQDLKRQLAAEYSKPIAKQINVARLEEDANNLEKDLVRSVAGFSEIFKQVNWQDVQRQLRPGEAALEFTHYQFFNPRATDSTMYAALLLLPGSRPPMLFTICEERQLHAFLSAPAASKADQANSLYAPAQQRETLYELLLQPLQSAIAGVHTIYFSPSGLLHQLNLGALSIPGYSKTIADQYHLVRLGSTRQLVTSSNVMDAGTSPLLYGGIQYDSAANNASELPISDRGHAFINSDSTLRNDQWQYLRWTDVEVNAIENLFSEVGWHPLVYRSYAATEESIKTRVKTAPSPRVIHFATHGFFFSDPKTFRQGTQLGDEKEPIFKISEQPMMRSGLILAGGNFAWKNGKPYRSDREDGILTAYEISQMNLRNTELVVLSACETGLGDIRGNEGVYGLQRAFKIAGAKYLLMSLWQVPDFQTQELMTTFYSKWLLDKMSIPDAFNAAQKVMREKYKDPFLWAGFVLVE